MALPSRELTPSDAWLNLAGVKQNPPALCRRQFLTVSALASSWVASNPLAALCSQAAERPQRVFEINDLAGSLGRVNAPVAGDVSLNDREIELAQAGGLEVRELIGGAIQSRPIPAQLIPVGNLSQSTRLTWMMPSGLAGKRQFVIKKTLKAKAGVMAASKDVVTGQYDLTEGGKPILRYNYANIEPGALVNSIAPGNRIYARARSNYIHPLYGPNGELLTTDWSVDHPHHRGIYWAWPEVDWRGQRGDLHALQQVFARPVGKCETTNGPVYAQVDAENLWKWEDREALVRERAIIRAWRSTAAGRWVDLEFHFTALNDPVALARRGTNAYGGLNVRLSTVEGQQITTHTDPAEAKPRMAWGEVSGIFAGANEPAGFVMIQQAGNPDYPGDWVQYPDLNWLQPTFPASGTRYELKRDSPLILRYRLWIHGGNQANHDPCADQWRAAHASASPLMMGAL